MTIGLVFSGQGSQRPGMGRAWQDTGSWQLVGELSESTGRDLAELLLDHGAEELARTDNAQLATFTLQMVILDALRAAGLPDAAVVACAGHSLGEYSALAAAGIAPLPDAAGLVLARSTAMLAATTSRPGTMGVVLGASIDMVEGLTADIRARGPEVWVANLNSAEQVVVSGTADGVTAVELECRALGVKMVRIPVGGAFHTPLMESAATAFAPALAAWQPRPGRVPVVSNVDARPYAGTPVWRELAARQLLSPVRWEETARCLVGELGCTVLVEIGAASPLTNLAKRMELPAVPLSVSTPKALAAVIDYIAAGSGGGTPSGTVPPPGSGTPAGGTPAGPVPAGPGTASRAVPAGARTGAVEVVRAPVEPARTASAPVARFRGRPPYGYRMVVEGGQGGTRTVVRRLVPDEVTAPVVRRIFGQYLAGFGLQGIAEGLTADAILCPSAHDQARNPHHGGIAWSKAAVRSILVNRRYTGQAGEACVEVPAYPPLADPEQFARVQQAFREKRSRPETPPRPPYLFRGLLRCGGLQPADAGNLEQRRAVLPLPVPGGVRRGQPDRPPAQRLPARASAGPAAEQLAGRLGAGAGGPPGRRRPGVREPAGQRGPQAGCAAGGRRRGAGPLLRLVADASDVLGNRAAGAGQAAPRTAQSPGPRRGAAVTADPREG